MGLRVNLTELSSSLPSGELTQLESKCIQHRAAESGEGAWLAVSAVPKNIFLGGKDGRCLVRGSADVEEALGGGVREETPDAVQTLDFEEALDGKTGAGQGTISGSQEECEDSV